MKFTIEKKVIIKHLEDVSKAIDSNNIYVHLRNFYINVLDKMIIIKGSNGYFSIESKIEIDKIISIEKIGNLLIPANMFINIVKKCENKILFYVENKVLIIENENDRYEINLIEEDEYPSIDFSLYGEKIILDSKKLRDAIEGVIFASSQTYEEMILTGINLKYEKGKLHVTATDSFRLAQEIVEIKDDRNITFDVTVTNKNIKNFIPSNIEGEVTLYVNEHKINLIKNTTNFQSKIIDAPYKDVSSIFNIQYSKKLTINKTILNNAINKAVFASGSDSYNKLNLVINNEKINIITNTDKIGRANVVISKDEYEYNGEEISITLNYKYLKEAINIFNDKINIHLIDSYKPIMINDDKKLNKQIISPMIS
ncbi:MAG: DNA polymerase III subunit beta [Mycoplasma sp.]|nr:DNA polymerase III subunit beta [Mycoplasma sp.]